MAATHFSGPVYSTAGFVGDFTGVNVAIETGTIKSLDEVSGATIANTTAAFTFANIATFTNGIKAGTIKSLDNVTGATIANVTAAYTFANIVTTTSGIQTGTIKSLDGVTGATIANVTAAYTFANSATFNGMTIVNATNIVLGTGTGTKIGTGTTQKLAFYNSAPVAQQATTGTSAGFTAGGGTTVTDASTFTGNSGSTAYRISDIVLALKNLGLLAA
jgi:hypothetical protein